MHDAGEGSKSSIAKRIRRGPQQRQPSAKQISLYVNLGKRRIANVYASRKRPRRATAHRSEQQEEEEIGCTTIEAEQVTTTAVAVIPDAGQCGKEQEVMAVQGERLQGDDEDAEETDIGADATTTVDSTPTVEVGEAPIL